MINCSNLPQSFYSEVNSMHYGQIPGVAKPVARLIQGTVMIGSDKLDYSFGLLDDILALGGNTFDAAHVYGNGDNERTLGAGSKRAGCATRS
jgi:aryl-alcohol dehydrogenase-like predicted oxidoreductase